MLQSGAGVSVRKGVAGDAKALSTVFRASWELAYRGIIPHLHLETMIRRRSAQWWSAAVRSGDSLLVLDVAGKVAGYVSCGPARARGSANQGEIYELYLDPHYQGLGFGERLFEAARHVLDQRRLKGLVVWSLIDNTPACHFYWRRGGRPVAKTVDRIGKKSLEKVAFTWS